MSSSNSSKEALFCQRLWREAAVAKEPIRVPYKRPEDAKRARFTFYNSVRHVRKDPTLDAPLAEAVENVSLSIVDEVWIQLAPRVAMDGPLMQALRGLGIDPETIKSSEDLEAAASEARMKAKLAEGLAEPVKKNPYY